MGDSRSTKKSSGEMENLALDANRFSRDLLQRFMGVSGGGGGGGSGGDRSERAEVGWREKEEAVDDDGELELNLGLSLGGRFGVDKSSNKLLRSSSIAACLPIVRDDDAVATPAAAAYSALVRTSSLPVETEEEWRKRKELQTMRRLEAKRRRSEKQRISRGDGGSGASSGWSNVEEPKREIGVNFRTRLDKEQLLAATKSSFRSGIDIGMFKGKRSCFSSNKMQPSSQGSIESQGANSSSMSELECKSLQGSCELSPGSIQSIQEGGNQETGSSRAKTTRDHPSRTVSGIETDPPPNKPESTSRQATREAGTGSLEDMPCVFTKGDGPNGKRIDGILYKYGKGEEVRIMCVCHGSFLSPAEFVKHAGGSDVAHPLKHIVINRNSSPFQ